MTDRELMQQALDLLDDINQCSLPPTGIPLPAEIDHVMEALRARLAQPEPEPVVIDSDGTVRLLKHPPQREWQWLTDEDIEDACWTEVDQRLRSFARAIEAMLKEKNT